MWSIFFYWKLINISGKLGVIIIVVGYRDVHRSCSCISGSPIIRGQYSQRVCTGSLSVQLFFQKNPSTIWRHTKRFYIQLTILSFRLRQFIRNFRIITGIQIDSNNLKNLKAQNNTNIWNIFKEKKNVHVLKIIWRRIFLQNKVRGEDNWKTRFEFKKIIYPPVL